MEKDYNLYILTSVTPTKTGKIIRTLGKTTYNHCAISLDPELKRLYAFARKKYNTVFLGQLVHETVRRYTLGKNDMVPVSLFKIPVTLTQYKWVQQEISRIQNDKQYRYNLFSVISYPIRGGFKTDKAFSCVEFVMHLLEGVDIHFDKEGYQIRPDDLAELLKEYIFFEGNLLDYVNDDEDDPEFFAPLSIREVRDTAVTIFELSRRLVTHKAKR